MSNFFFGRMLNTQALIADQTYIALPGKPSPEPQQLAVASGRFDPGVDPVALNPQPLPPEDKGINADLLATLPSSLLDTVALNPQPLPPAEIADTLSPVALNPQPLPPAESGLSRDLIASLPGSFLDAVALNPQPLPPAEIGRDMLSPVALNPQPLPPAEIGRSALSLVALNPQPLPPQESPSAMNMPLSLPSGLGALLPSPAELLAKANVIGSVTDGLQGGPELQRHELWRDVARPADQIGFGGSERERHTLKNLIDDDVAHGAKRSERERVKPWSPSDYIGGIGSYPIEGDRMRPPLFVKGAGDVDEVSMNDIDQQAIGDCFFLGSLAAVVRHDPQRIKDMVVDHGDGTYTVTFKERVPYTEPAQFVDRPITVKADFPGGLKGSGHAGGGDVTKQGTVELWPLVFEKAYGQYLNALNPYGTLALGGSSQLALEAITGRAAKADGEWDYGQMGISKPIYLGPPAKDFDELLSDFQAGKAITVCTSKLEQSLVPSHCYAVDKVYQDADGNRWVELYNPWGNTHGGRIPFEQLQNHRMYTA